MASEAIKVQLCSIGKSKFIMTYKRMKKKTLKMIILYQRIKQTGINCLLIDKLICQNKACLSNDKITILL